MGEKEERGGSEGKGSWEEGGMKRGSGKRGKTMDDEGGG